MQKLNYINYYKESQYCCLSECIKPEIGIFCDFDETYKPLKKVDAGIEKLEYFLQQLSKQKNFVFGWISGSNLKSLLEKCNDYIKVLPHFISSSLGTELYWCDKNGIYEDHDWKKMLKNSGFTHNAVKRLLEVKLKDYKINLIWQNQDSQGNFKVSYYYKVNDNEKKDFETLKKIGKEINVDVKISLCNPATGDPSGHYDVEFIPNQCGKKAIVGYIIKKYNTIHKTIGFGDSCNDLEMLDSVNHGFLVGNSAIEARILFPSESVLSECYCYGIMSGIKSVINKS